MKTERSRLRRLHERGHYDHENIYQVLDAGRQCSVGYVFKGAPYVTPTIHWREGNRVYWHGSSASQMLRAANGADVCLTVAILDGYVMARSGMHHSVNTRSVMLFGRAEKVPDELKEEKMKNMVEGLFPGRWDILRPATKQEIKATTILSMEIDEGSAKIRTGAPGDDEEDYALPIWAGVIPVRTVVDAPIDDPRNLPEMTPPDHILAFRG
jgi:nitroimidazol reductase NimA-like FMN-containing flavoprotein (pyridoxamine 5'-phosphate oxidase superfamily)